MPLSNSSVLFGPYCEYALAQVARLIKVLLLKQKLKIHKYIFKLYDVPLITSGGLTTNFKENKTIETDEFYLLTRTGFDYRCERNSNKSKNLKYKFF